VHQTAAFVADNVFSLVTQESNQDLSKSELPLLNVEGSESQSKQALRYEQSKRQIITE
jgi:hypothetical protein